MAGDQGSEILKDQMCLNLKSSVGAGSPRQWKSQLLAPPKPSMSNSVPLVSNCSSHLSSWLTEAQNCAPSTSLQS